MCPERVPAGVPGTVETSVSLVLSPYGEGHTQRTPASVSPKRVPEPSVTASDSSQKPKGCVKCDEAHERCIGHNRAGHPCGLHPLAGQRVCGMHGGKTPRALAAAEQRLAAQAADEMLTKLWPGLEETLAVTDPVAELSKLAGSLQQMVDVVGGRVSALQHLGAGEHMTQLRAEVVLLDKLLAHSRGALSELARLDLGKRHIELQQGQGQLVVDAARAGIEAAGLDEVQARAFIDAFLSGLGRGPVASAGVPVVAGEVAP